MASREVPLTIGVGADETEKLLFWGDKGKATLLFGTVNDAEGAAFVDVNVTRPAGVVKRYPGDPRPFTRKGTSYGYVLYRGRSGAATPGDPFWCEVPAELLPGQTRKVYQFTTNESNSQIAYVIGNVISTAMIVRFNSGKAVTIEPQGFRGP
jgi:hypothetical protein